MVYQEYCFELGPCLNLETGLGNESNQNASEGLAHTSLCQEVDFQWKQVFNIKKGHQGCCLGYLQYLFPSVT
ncbi:hypothetical protein CY35_09G010100 [Sphagnum magellanicum]|nr:hypothetical protein CY35_09G010100 [Sphagnum magellanicum]